MKISVIGVGYVGLATAAVLADLGNDVLAADVDKKKIDGLNRGKMPIFEPGLKEIVGRNVKEKRLRFVSDNKEVIEYGDVIFICVGTPPKDNWETEIKYVEDVALEVSKNMKSYKVIVHKSTVPVETGAKVKKIIKENIRQDIDFDVVSNPEFLREGSAINDTLNPDRIVVGSDSKKAIDIMKEIYDPIKAPLIITSIKSAELIKHASNAFLATKVSFINSVAKICELCGADIEEVAEGMGYDKRISKHFLNAGLGYGGFCFPKDSQAFIKIAENYGYDYKLLKATNEINDEQKKIFLDKIKKALGHLDGKNIGVLGLAFKPNTDDMRFAPSVYVINELKKEGAKIKAYDPEAMEKAKAVIDGIDFCDDSYEVAKDADAILIITEWNEFKEMDLKKLKGLLRNPLIIDGRNIYDLDNIEKEGFNYISIGRREIKQN
jgi:UDPglucose 6-dehydrogenase